MSIELNAPARIPTITKSLRAQLPAPPPPVYALYAPFIEEVVRQNGGWVSLPVSEVPILRHKRKADQVFIDVYAAGFIAQTTIQQHRLYARVLGPIGKRNPLLDASLRRK